MNRLIVSAAALALFFTANAGAREAAPLSRETELAQGMLAFAGVGRDDVIYDLGYGDGRILIEAARLFGCRGTGIYSDIGRTEACTRDADAAGVAALVSFAGQDIFSAEIAKATVVCVYLLPRDGARLRPHLLATLKPGARIVSRDFTLGAWRPDARTVIRGSNVYRWTVPENMSGRWKWDGKGNQRFVLNVRQEFQDATGTVTAWPVKGRVSSMRIAGEQVSFSIETEYAAETRTVNYEGRVTGNIIEGMGEESGNRFVWQARRVQGTERPLEALPE